MGYIYLITNKINGKKYVGQTIQSNINDRWREHKSVDSKVVGRYLYNAYVKHGIENFKYQIICICFDSDCNKFEEYYIKKFNCLVPNGYNLMSGGGNFNHHPETIKKMKIAQLGQKNHGYGKHLSEEHKKKISDSNKGEKHPNYGKKMSEERKQKISETRKKLISEGKINYKLSEKQVRGLEIGVELLRKKVGKYNDEGILLATYDSVTDASKQENICRSTISNVCNSVKRYKKAGGYIWKFIEKE